METNNPVFNPKRLGHARYNEQAMSINGTINKITILFALMLSSSAVSWVAFFSGYHAAFGMFMITGFIGGLILAFATIFKPVWSPITAPLYAICEGLAIGAISASASAEQTGIVTVALGLTLSIFSAMLLIYKTGLIKVTSNFRIAVISAIGGVFVFQMLTFIFSLFGVNVSLFTNGSIGFAISLIIIGVASLSLMLDFDFITQGEEQGYAKYMEWYFAFGLLVSVVWLYIQILRMLSRRR